MLCHGSTAPLPIKATHPWTTSETCNACHRTSPQLLPLPVAAAPAGNPPEIPHNTGGLEDCLLCHGPGEPRAFGGSHPWSTTETCTTCHQTAAQTLPVPPSVNQAPAIPHSIEGLDDCRLCHGAGVPYPANHATIPTSFCTLCHSPA